MDTTDILNRIKEEIVQLVQPQTIILFSYKQDINNHLTSFKLCVILNTDNKKEVERKLYLNLECSIPFDVIVYTTEEWERALTIDFSFAQTVQEKGMVLYG